MNQFRSIITIGLTRCNVERRGMTHLPDCDIRTYIHAPPHVYDERRRESSRRCNDHCLQSPLLLHYSSPKWMMQIMFRANSRVYTHARENSRAFTLTRIRFSFFSCWRRNSGSQEFREFFPTHDRAFYVKREVNLAFLDNLQKKNVAEVCSTSLFRT